MENEVNSGSSQASQTPHVPSIGTQWDISPTSENEPLIQEHYTGKDTSNLNEPLKCHESKIFSEHSQQTEDAEYTWKCVAALNPKQFNTAKKKILDAQSDKPSVHSAKANKVAESTSTHCDKTQSTQTNQSLKQPLLTRHTRDTCDFMLDCAFCHLNVMLNYSASATEQSIGTTVQQALENQEELCSKHFYLLRDIETVFIANHLTTNGGPDMTDKLMSFLMTFPATLECLSACGNAYLMATSNETKSKAPSSCGAPWKSGLHQTTAQTNGLTQMYPDSSIKKLSKDESTTLFTCLEAGLHHEIKASRVIATNPITPQSLYRMERRAKKFKIPETLDNINK